MQARRDDHQSSLETGRIHRRQLLRVGALAVGGYSALLSGYIQSGPVRAQDGTPTAAPVLDSDSFRFSTFGWSTDFSVHSVDLDEIRPGGPGKDGIAPIDQPAYETIAEAGEWLAPREPVVSVALETANGVIARAYPIQILIWHEIVNDVLGDLPVLATFCPLCNTAIAFDRRLEGDATVYDFGTTGNLRFSDLIMWDRQTESWWQQITGEAIVGTLTGSQLTFLPAQILGWDSFKELFPDGDVLSRETGFSRPYGSNPYTGYDDVSSSPFLFDQQADGRLRPMERVVGVDFEGEQAAYLTGDIIETEAINDVLGGQPIALLLAPGSTSATEESEISASREVGQVGVFLATVDDQILTFVVEDDAIRDNETGSTWSVSGRAVDGDLAGATLTALPHVVVFWFAWAAAFPETRLWNG